MSDTYDVPSTMTLTAPEPFDLVRTEPLTFAALEDGRSWVFESRDQARSFRQTVESLGTNGDEGRRRGMGMWILGEYQRCADELAQHESDDTAAMGAHFLGRSLRVGKILVFVRDVEQVQSVDGIGHDTPSLLKFW